MNFQGALRYLIHRVWLASYAPKHRAFVQSLSSIQETQQSYLLRTLANNTSTLWGREHGFTSIRTIREYQQLHPVTTYADYEPYIRKASEGNPTVLTASPLMLLHPTSGTHSGKKLIPWNQTLAHEFQAGIAPWISSLYQRRPGLMSCTAYWSASPPTNPVDRYGCLKVGFSHDSEYLGFLGETAFSAISSTPPELVGIKNMPEFLEKTIASLLSDENLGLISIWSPTFLTVLLDQFLAAPEKILAAIHSHKSPCHKARVKQIERHIQQQGKRAFESIWPRLQVISCWTHGTSELYANNLRAYFPSVEIQGKGITATEALVSFPWHVTHDPVLSLTSHFFEFEEVETKEIHLAHELAKDKCYSVIMTTGGGLYRYRLGDIVLVTGFIHQAPCFRFVGREGITSDHCGEKLNSAFVDQVLKELFLELNIDVRFALLAPVHREGTQMSYALFLQSYQDLSGIELAARLDVMLSKNFHYQHCRRLGQLGRPHIFQIHQTSPSPESIFIEALQSRGQKLGEIKMASLDADFGWEQKFSKKSPSS